MAIHSPILTPPKFPPDQLQSSLNILNRFIVGEPTQGVSIEGGSRGIHDDRSTGAQRGVGRKSCPCRITNVLLLTRGGPDPGWFQASSISLSIHCRHM